MQTLPALLLCMYCAVTALAQNKEEDRLTQSHDVLKEILGILVKGIPRDLLNKAECVVVFPSVKKVGFGVGASAES
jgi:lipid-binding SYLF domain-containing protein